MESIRELPEAQVYSIFITAFGGLQAWRPFCF
jgi:hypothetical protein